MRIGMRAGWRTGIRIAYWHLAARERPIGLGEVVLYCRHA
jgi:hypothetical protein